MEPICPDCREGKHHNCNGVGNVDAANNPIPCLCTVGDHIHRKPIVDPQGRVLFDWDGNHYFKVDDSTGVVDFATREEVEEALNQASAELSFPELSDEDLPWDYNFRIKPDKEILKDLMDVEVMNPAGVWVPAVPLPIHLLFGVKQCHCGKRRIGLTRYQEHYAYAHILGMAE